MREILFLETRCHRQSLYCMYDIWSDFWCMVFNGFTLIFTDVFIFGFCILSLLSKSCILYCV